MNWLKDTLHIQTRRKGLHPITPIVEARLAKWGVKEGMCFLYVQHTSASLVINENYDPFARSDMEAFMDRLAPPAQPWHQHTMEGDDDSPSHMRAMITPTSLAIPIDGGRLSLGRWQGIYLFEQRQEGQSRQALLRCLSVE